MNPLQILPPFTYSYQCGSAIVTSYIPVYMYATSLQLVSVILSTILIFTADHVIKYPSQILQRFPLVYWPDWDEDRSNSLKSSRMIRPHQILSILCSNLILLLSFGLCSPALGFYITASICFYGCFWLMVIGRYICLRKGQGIEKEIEVGEPKLRCDDEFVQLLNHQLQSLDLSDIKVCKWPVICTTCMFMTLLCWDMVGDQVGWYDAIWVPVVGSFILLLLWVWGLLLDRGVLDRYVSFQLFTPVTVSGHNMSNPPQLQVSSSNSVEFVTSSLHVIKEG